MTPPEPVRQAADAAARATARALLANAPTAVLGWLDPATGGPRLSRVALAVAADGMPVTLISALAPHSRALRLDPRASLLVGDVAARGDPLNHPRLSVAGLVQTVPRTDLARAALRAAFLAQRPRVAVYIDFDDFDIVLFRPQTATLIGGFGKAVDLDGRDLGPDGA